jgi:hypothetical protein
MKTPKTLRGFLLARISEEETLALDARSWYHGGAGTAHAIEVGRVTETFAAFVLAHDADRALNECIAKRRIIKLLTGQRWSGSEEDRESILRLLALPYAGHPTFRDEWRTTSSDVD